MRPAEPVARGRRRRCRRSCPSAAGPPRRTSRGGTARRRRSHRDRRHEGLPYSATPSTSSSRGGTAQRSARGRRRIRRQSGDQRRMGRGEAHLGPADVRQLEAAGVERADLPLDDPEPGAPPCSRNDRMRAASPGRFRARARPRAHALADQLVEAELAQAPHRARKGADAGNDEAVGARSSAGSPLIGRARRRARAPSRPSDGCPSRSR